MADKKKRNGKKKPEVKKALFYDMSLEEQEALREAAKEFDAWQETEEAKRQLQAFEAMTPTEEEIEIMRKGNSPRTFAMIDAMHALGNAISNVQSQLEAIAQFNREHPEVLENFLSMRDAEWNILPFMGLAISDEAKTDPSLLEIAPLDILRQGIDDEGRPTESKYKAVIEKAIALQHAFFESETDLADLATITQALDPDITPETEEKIRELIARIAPQWEGRENAQIIKALIKSDPAANWPVDKLSTAAWSFFPAALRKHDGQYQFLKVDTSKKGSNTDAIILFSAKENGITLSRDLSATHEWVHNIVGNLSIEGNNVFSLTHLYREMGKKDNPNADDLKDLLKLLTEMRHIDITVDNAQEHGIYKNYPQFKYEGSLLPFEIITAEINGALVEGAIHLLREPPLMQFARERKQLASFPKEVLKFPLSKTEANISLARYLIRYICRIKNPHTESNHRLSFDTIFEHCGMNTRAKRNQRATAPKKIAQILNYWQEIGWINGYTYDNDCIVFDIDTAKKIPGGDEKPEA